MSHFIDRTGESTILPNGQKATIIAYRNNKDIDVRFDDGHIGRGLTYSHFKKGDISGKKINKYQAQKDRLGEERILNCGVNAKIIRYVDSTHITIKTDDGEEIDTTYERFRIGQVVPTGYEYSFPKRQSEEIRQKAIGQTVLAGNGQKMTCIDYNKSIISVQFEDGTIVHGVHYNNFKIGKVLNPNFRNKGSVRHVGERNVNTQGHAMTLIKYDDWNHCLVRFDDGTVAKGAYNQFKSGKLENPNAPRERRNVRTGESQRSTCGLLMKITRYDTSADIDVEFEDGETAHTAYQSFVHGNVAHPKLRARSTSNYKGFKTEYIGQIDGNTLYTAECEYCGEKAILTPQQMMEHEKKHAETIDCA